MCPYRIDFVTQPTNRGGARFLVAVAFVVGACGGAEPGEQVRWTLDTAGWPDCGWDEHHLVYSTGVDVRVHDLATGDDRQVWADAKLREVVEIDESTGPTGVLLSSDRRWMILTLMPPLGADVPLLALSCDGGFWQRLGPQRPESITAHALSPDNRWLALGYREAGRGQSTNVAVPDGRLLLDLERGDIRRFATYGRALGFSADSKRLLYYANEKLDEQEDPYRLALLSVADAKPTWESTRDFNLWSDCAWDGTSDYAYCTGRGVARMPFDDSRAIEEVFDSNMSDLELDADGKLYGLFMIGELHEVDVTKGEVNSRWSTNLPRIRRFSF